MKNIIPNKLKKGDEIRVIAPSRSMKILSEENIKLATKKLESIGFKVSFGKNVSNVEDSYYGCASIEDRVQDLHDAFKDENVKGILTVLGGYNVNQILDYIDYDLIKSNPKIICGFSDITALLNTIYAKTGLVTYYGPHFSSFAMKKGFDYTLEYFKKIFMEENEEILIKNSEEWSDNNWFRDQENRNFIKNSGTEIIQNGTAEGTIIGGNLCTLNLLQGTDFMPDVDNIILFLEDDDLAGKGFLKEFDRNLASLLHCYRDKKIKGIVVGRAQVDTEMSVEKWISLFRCKRELKGIPIIVNADFGHTTPIFTFPIGGVGRIDEGEVVIGER